MGQAGLPEELVGPVTCNLGGGMAKGETCGALLGAEIALGLCMRRDGRSFDKKEQHEAAGNLLETFNSVFDGLNCRDLKKGDPAVPDSHVLNCSKIVKQAAQQAFLELHKWRPDF